MNKKKSKSGDDRIIAKNRKARHEYKIEENFEGGLVLEGWEVKALRDGRGNIAESYVVITKSEAWLIGCHITPLGTASTHVNPEPTRSRKILLQRRELSKLIGAVERAGYTLIPLDLHWTRGRAKLDIGLAKGKKMHDKRADIKERDWSRDKQRLMKNDG
ncbi:MAG: SsrA-binding protein SmpB [Oceanococcus sp.]